MVFPDEKDEDNIGIRTRSGKRLSAQTQFPAIQSTSSSNATMLQTLDALAKWKQSTLCFNECVMPRCDPLRKFLNYNRDVTCKRCQVFRNRLQNEFILVYPSKAQLVNTLFNYLYFHAIKVFDVDADQNYARNKPEHPYFIGYTHFRELKHILTTNIVACFNVPMVMQSAVCRPFIFRSKLTMPNLEIGQSIDDEKDEEQHSQRTCDLCNTQIDQWGAQQSRHKPTVLVTISGRPYLRHDFQFATTTTMDAERLQQFWLCKFHYRFFNCLYTLTHMDWNVHLNLRRRIIQLLEQNCEMNAEQLINGIEPIVFSKLLNAYLPTIRILDMNYENWHAFNGKAEWMRFYLTLKNEAIFKFTRGMVHRNNSKRQMN